MKEVPGSEKQIDADLVLLAMGFTGPEQTLARAFSVSARCAFAHVFVCACAWGACVCLCCVCVCLRVCECFVCLGVLVFACLCACNLLFRFWLQVF